SACISGSREASEALLAMGLRRTHAAGGLRLTFGGGATADDAARAAAALRAVAERIRLHAGVTAR
ncbi:MAG: aminotransferase class V-fold PLP-dependent enzyme, partial [Candidatus Limnocylindrus sp.]